jgi:type IV pilus assembly protein PilE
MKKVNLGFTLIELMVVLAIIAIIAAIAYPSYNQSIMRTRRAAAGGCLHELTQFMERFYSTNMTYANAVLQPSTFQFNVVPAANTYSIDATPIGPQVADPCGTLNINELGTKIPDPVVSPQCWR